MRVAVRERIYLSPETDEDLEVIGVIKRELTYPNPRHADFEVMRKRGTLGPKGDFARNPYPPEVQNYWRDIQTGGVKLPRGYLRRLKKRVPGHYLDVRHRCEKALDISLSVETRWYQEEAVQDMLTQKQGVLRADCGSGKTVTGVAVLAAIKKPAVVIVHEKKLLRQWEAELRAKAPGSYTIGRFGDGKKKKGDIILATTQTLKSLSKRSPEAFREIAEYPEVVIMDEVHHVPAPTFWTVVNEFPALYRFGLSATPRRKDRMEFRLWDCFGPVIHNVDSKVLEDDGHILSARVLFIHTGVFSFDVRWTQAVTDLTKNHARTATILGHVKRNVADGRTVLILSDRVEHCKVMVEDLRRSGIVSELMIGEVPAEDRERIRKDPSVQVVVGTTVADEGLDMPRLDTVHFTCPSNNFGRIKQRAGRIRRVLHGKKDPLVYDYVDTGPIMQAVANKRYRWYDSFGFAIGGDDDGHV